MMREDVANASNSAASAGLGHPPGPRGLEAPCQKLITTPASFFAGFRCMTLHSSTLYGYQAGRMKAMFSSYELPSRTSLFWPANWAGRDPSTKVRRRRLCRFCPCSAMISSSTAPPHPRISKRSPRSDLPFPFTTPGFLNSNYCNPSYLWRFYELSDHGRGSNLFSWCNI